MSAILVKAESLYNTCFFEHGLILFHRGKALAPENEEFRLGIQKCHKTIGMDWFCPELFILTLINYLNYLKYLKYLDELGIDLLNVILDFILKIVFYVINDKDLS